MHIKTGTSNGAYEVIDSGITIFTYSGNVMNGGTIGNVYLDLDATGKYAYSNIIISDTTISADEKVAVLPMKMTLTTDWIDNDGSYSVSEIDKSLTEVLDIDKFLNNVGQTNVAIKAVSINALNVSYAGTVNALTSEVVSDSTEQVVCTKALSSTGWYTPAMISNPLASSDWSLSELRRLRLGVKSAGV